MKRIDILLPNTTLSAELFSTPTADRIIETLPIKGRVNRWGEEIYFEIPLSLPLEADARADVTVGDLGYWPTGQAFCIFFGPTPVSTGDAPRAYSPVNVFGHIAGDLSALRSIDDGVPVIVAAAEDDSLPLGVCFDFMGTLLDHRSRKDLVHGMEELIRSLKERNVPVGLISRNPVSVVKETLGDIADFFGLHIYSSGEKDKLDYILQFAAACGIKNFKKLVFIDDKPENILSIATHSPICVIGFFGSGKYPETRDACLEKGILFAETAADLEKMLGCNG